MQALSFTDCGLPKREVYDFSTYQKLSPSSQQEALDLFDGDTFVYDIITGCDLKTFIILSPRLSERHSKYLQERIAEQGFTVSLLLPKIKSHIVVCRNPTSKQFIELGCRSFPLDEPNSLVSHLACKRPSKISYTLQKDEHLDHINDWVAFQLHEYLADLVILFDNNSSACYDFGALSSSLLSLGDSVFLKHVPFKYGPAGTTTDGQLLKAYKDLLLQASMFEYVKSCIMLAGLQEALLLNTDIDELIFCRGDTTPFTLLPGDKLGLLFSGYWCYPPVSFSEEGIATYEDHVFINPVNRISGDRKWLLRVNEATFPCWQSAHLISRLPDNGNPESVIGEPDATAFFLHHYAVTNRWRGTRSVSDKQEGVLVSAREFDVINKMISTYVPSLT
jgi:hypothetical protein